MTTKEIIDYVEGELKKGEQKDAIKARLLQNGWSGNDIEETFGVVGSKTSGTKSVFAPAPITPLRTSTSFWDFKSKKIYKNRKEKLYDFLFGSLGFVIIWIFVTSLTRLLIPFRNPNSIFASNNIGVPLTFFIPSEFVLAVFQGLIFFIFGIVINIYFFKRRIYIVRGIIAIFIPFCLLVILGVFVLLAMVDMF